MKRLIPLFALVLLIALAACGGQTVEEATPAAETAVEAAPTEAPATAEPVEEVAPVEEPMGVTQPWVGTVWQWQGTTTPAEQITVADPSRYTVLFNEDGSVNIQADCNTVLGQYTTGGSSLTIMLGPSTLAACPPDTQDQVFLTQISSAAQVLVENGELFIDQFADAGTMRFAAAGAAAAEPTMTGVVWQWQGTTTPAEQIAVTDPSRYTVLFNEDGSVNIKADCNTVLGQYTTDGSGGLTITLGPSTLMACPPDSQDQVFLTQLSSAARMFIENGELYIEQLADAGTMRFAAAAEPVLTGVVWQWQGTTTPAEQITVADPSRYTVLFNEDGSVNIQADCNTVLGQYTTDDSGSLSITLGPSTLAACPPDSQDQAFLTQLSSAARLFFENGELYIDQFADGGTMRFAAAAEPALTGVTWAWLGTTTPVEQINVADPTRYTIEFNEDGTAFIKADCNNVIGQYTTDGSSLTMTLGPSTLVACPPDSQDQIFLSQIASAAIYFFEDGDLFIDMMADGGTMRFVALPEVDLPDAAQGEPTGTVNAPDGVFLRSGPGTNYPAVGTAPQGESGKIVGISEDGQWYVAAAPSLPEGQVWVSAAFVDAANTEGLPVVPAPPLPTSLIGVTWNWVSLTNPTTQTLITDPARYTITFGEDGSAAIQADCNQVLAQYRVDGTSITIVPGPSTLAACPPDTQDSLFLQSLSAVTTYSFQGADLLLEMPADAGVMRFVAAGSVSVPGEGSVSGGAGGTSFRVSAFGPAGAPVPVLAGTTITAIFDDVAGIVSGSSGCNTYTGTLNPVENFFTVGPIATTLLACETPPGVMEQEAAYLAALGGTNGYRWEQQRTATGTLVTAGQLFYALADGSQGVINLVSP